MRFIDVVKEDMHTVGVTESIYRCTTTVSVWSMLPVISLSHSWLVLESAKAALCTFADSVHKFYGQNV